MGELLPFKRPEPKADDPVVGEIVSEYRSALATCGCCGHEWLAMFPVTIDDVANLLCPTACKDFRKSTVVKPLGLTVHDQAGSAIQ